MSVDATKIAEPERFLQAFALILLVGTGAVFAVRGHRGLALSLLLLTLFAWGRADCFGLWRASKDCCFVGYLVSEITYALIVRLGSVLISLGVVASLTADLGTQSFEIVTVIRRLEPLGWVTLFFFYFLFVSRNGLELWAYLLGATETEPPATMGGIYSSVVRLVVHLSAHLAILSGLGMASGLSETYEPLFIGSIAILLPTVLGNAQTGLLTLERARLFYSSLAAQLIKMFLITTFVLGILFWLALTVKGEPDLGIRLFWGLSGVSSLIYGVVLIALWNDLRLRNDESTFVPKRVERTVDEDPPEF